jgi:hypothetical protein
MTRISLPQSSLLHTIAKESHTAEGEEEGWRDEIVPPT